LGSSASSALTSIDRFSLSQLPNGIRIASLNTPGPCIAGGLLIETPANAHLPPVFGNTGASFILEKLAFKATRNLTEQKMHIRLDELLGTVQAKARRESILYSGAIVPSQLENLLSLLREVSSNPLITEEDLTTMNTIVTYELDELRNKPDELLPEMAHGPAFYSKYSLEDGPIDWNSILGLPVELQHCTINSVMDYWQKCFTASNMIILGTGMPHGILHNAAVDTFGSLEQSPKTNNTSDTQPLSYCGGFNYVTNDDLPLVHVAIAFEGCPAASPRAYSLAILHMLMGGGSSFSAGGPGKGMYSRLYTQVLNRYHWIESARIFSNFYRDTGLFGIHGSALPSNTRDLVEVLLKQLYSMTEPLTPEELSRAKNQVKSSLLMGLESRLTELEDLADQVSYLQSKYRSMRHLCEQIDRVTNEDLQSTAKELLQSKPTVVAYGPLHRMPPYEMISKWHNSRGK